jgi:hypothetical protein
MGDCTKTLRETGLKVQATMSMHGGEHSGAENVKMFKASDLCRDLTVGGANVKTKLSAAIAKWHKRNVMNSLVSKAGE